MRITGTSVCGAALALAIVAAPSRPAFAQAAPSPDETKPAVKIGPMEIWPTIVLRNIGADNNVFNDAENPRSDFTATISPTVQVVVRPQWMRMSFTSLSDFVYYAQYESERSVNRGFRTRLDLNLSYLQPYVIAGAMLTKERLNNEIDVRARRQLRNYGAGLALRLTSTIGVSAGVRHETSRFTGGDTFRGADLATELNNETNAIDANFTADVTPLTTVGLAVAIEQDRFDSQPLRNSDSWRVTPTVSFKPFGLMSGSASVGYMTFDALDPLVEDYSGLVATGTIGIFLLDRYRIETMFGRDVQYSYDRETPTFVLTSGRVSLRTDLFAGLDVKVTGGREVMRYRALGEAETPGRDVYDVYGAGLGYTLANNMRLGVDAEFSERKSGRAGRGFQNNRIFGTLTWGVNPQ